MTWIGRPPVLLRTRIRIVCPLPSQVQPTEPAAPGCPPDFEFSLPSRPTNGVWSLTRDGADLAAAGGLGCHSYRAYLPKCPARVPPTGAINRVLDVVTEFS